MRHQYTILDYLQLLTDNQLVIESSIEAVKDVSIEHLTYNSKDVIDRTLFICKGETFKKDYLEMALSSGAVCYISEQKYEVSLEASYVIVKDIRVAMAYLADMFNNSAWKDLNLIGITGTKGKSTTVYFLRAILDDYLLAEQKKDCGIISSIDLYDGVINELSQLTTPESVELHKHFYNAVHSDLEYMIMEVSSQALKYNRVDQVKFDVGVFLNISEDHISPIEHPDFDDYFGSKLKMFDDTKIACINLDSDCLEEIKVAAQKAEQVITFGTTEEADIYGYNIHKEGHETVLNIRCDKFDQEFRLSIPGRFNVENALAAVAAVYPYDIPVEHIFNGLYKSRPSGRMELYTTNDQKVAAIVDFAHNKLSFEKLFSSVKDEYKDYKIVAIFGCPGGKAYTRREAMGKIAAQYADYIYIVADDPGEEPFWDIAKEIEQYVKATSCPYEMIEERKEAIKKAMESVDGETVLVIAGKGSDEFQKYGKRYVPCESDGQVVVKYIREYDEKQNITPTVD